MLNLLLDCTFFHILLFYCTFHTFNYFLLHILKFFCCTKMRTLFITYNNYYYIRSITMKGMIYLFCFYQLGFSTFFAHMFSLAVWANGWARTIWVGRSPNSSALGASTAIAKMSVFLMRRSYWILVSLACKLTVRKCRKFHFFLKINKK